MRDLDEWVSQVLLLVMTAMRCSWAAVANNPARLESITVRNWPESDMQSVFARI